MKKIKLTFIAVAVIAALSAFTTNYFYTYHYLLENGQLVYLRDYDPINCEAQLASQCTFLFESSTTTPHAIVTPQDTEWNSIITNPDPFGVDKVYIQ